MTLIGLGSLNIILVNMTDKNDKAIAPKADSGLWLDVAIIGVVALALRLVHLYAAAASPIFGYLTFDSIYYHTIAQYMAAGEQLGHEGVFKAPLYGMLIALNYGIFGINIFSTLFLQNILGTISCLLVYAIGRSIFPRRIALTAGLLAAACGTMIYFDSEVLPVSLTITFLLLSLWLLLMYGGSRNIFYLIGSALACSIGTYLLPEILLLIPAAMYWLVRQRDPGPVSRVHLLVFAAIVVLSLVPLQIRNQSIGRETIPLVTDVGLRLAVANSPTSTGRDLTLPNSDEEFGESYLSAVEAANRTNGREVPLENFGGFWFGQALKYIFGNPIDWAKLELRKLGLLLSGYEIALDKPIYFFAEQSPVLRWLLWEGMLSFPLGLLMPLALLTFFTGRGWTSGERLVLLSAIAWVVAVLVFSPFSHQRLPLVPLVIILAAAGFWGLVGFLRNGDYRRFYRNLAVFAVGLVVVNGVIYIANPDVRVNSKLEGHLFTANALLTAGQPQEAQLEFEQALRQDSRSPRPYSGIAGILLRQGSDSLAVLNYMRAAGLAPEDDRPYKGVVSSLKRRQKVTELNQTLVEVIRLFPKARWAYVEYADLHMRLKEYTQAADIYEEAFQADSTYFDAIFRRAECYLLGDMRQEAEVEFKRFLEYIPSSIEAHANLGQVYARQRRLDLAQEQFEFVRRIQPYNPASYFNLSSLALQRNEFDRSHAYLDTARMLNPQFPGLDLMHRMIDSLRTAQN